MKTIRITDPELIQAFRDPADKVRVTDADGEVLGAYTPENLLRPPPDFASPISDEEWERRRTEAKPGRSLKEIIKDLEARG